MPETTQQTMEDFRYPLLQTMLYDQPLMVAPNKAEILHNVLQGYAAGSPPAIDAVAFKANTERKPYTTTTGGVAVISVVGSLVHRGGFLNALSGMTSYRSLTSLLRRAEKDADVKAIMLDVDSPGGSVAGLFDLAKEIRRINATKPVWSISNEDMFSAAYAIGSASSRIIAPETAMAGSIGVVMMHLDQSKADEKSGKKYTPIYAGYHKVDGSSHAPLSDAARATFQNTVDQMYGIFVRHVAAGRGMDEQAVIDTQAQIYTATDAVDVGLVDQIASHDEALDMLEAHIKPSVNLTLASASNNKEVTTMSKDNLPDGETTITQADLDAARVEGTEAGHKAGVDAEKSRVDSILKLESAGGKIDATLSAAIENGLDAEAADKFLLAAPVAQPGNAFAAAMDALGNPEVGGDAADDPELTADQIATRAVSLIQHKGA
jgi:signal peptide peptidase SppA